MRIPDGLRYSRDHLWVLVDGEQARVGITDHHQDALGEIVFAKLPSVGDSISAGQTAAEVESSKSVSDVYAPITEASIPTGTDPQTFTVEGIGKINLSDIKSIKY